MQRIDWTILNILGLILPDSSVRVADSNPGAGEDLGKVVGARNWTISSNISN